MCKLDVDKYFANNREWVKTVLGENQDYFQEIKEGQQPKALLLGCSDSRVSPTTVLGTELGELFIHRNIANVVSHSDLNFLSVMQYAVESLEVRDIIVYGHYGCGGIKAAYENKNNGLIDNWLANIKDVIRHYNAELKAIEDEEDRLKRLVELNVLEQIANIKQTSVYRDALDKGLQIRLHAWVFDFSTGIVHDLKKKYNIIPAVH
ncbi:carbonic anhydrase [Rhodonellum psychrophilum GCM71 = DSM 17998]|uniref:Carbonic anhydrase n=2 Tax=Rhodonellum TaxID=336827 RepID=U5C6F3_9BACT|nr:MULTISPECIES: carbonic anhydrase [Rhodonellum]ERM84531.1 carbonic anhydrase [Rhodonellum psychrophilum GCM71 = DSM 17998]MDO9554805.1 carbonic anhydrase [Rhodonellum sp.]SDY84434.1 carbonic anhydrase [Rhodonellum ikkaensis]